MAIVGSEHVCSEVVHSAVVASSWLHLLALQQVDGVASSLSEIVASLLGIVWLCPSALSVGYIKGERLVHGEWTLVTLTMARDVNDYVHTGPIPVLAYCKDSNNHHHNIQYCLLKFHCYYQQHEASIYTSNYLLST